MEEKDLDKIIEKMNKMIDDMGKREEFEKFKKERENKSLEELLDELKESMEKTKEKINNFKPNVKILVETDENGEERTVEIKGNRPSIMLGLAELTTELVQNSNLTEEDIRFAIETGIKTANEEA